MYPPTLQAFREEPDLWSHRIHDALKANQPSLEPDYVVIYGGLPAGTSLRIVQVLSKFDGENGNYWMAFAVVLDGEFKGRRLLLPVAAASIADWEFVARCDNHQTSKATLS
jgi:hypothetical protein